MAKLHYIGKEDYLINYSCNSTVLELCEWFNKQKVIQFDTETNVCNSIVERELKVLQFGNLEGSEIFVIQKSALTDDEFTQVKMLLDNKEVLKIIHNASFDYQVMLNEGIVMENVWDTMVMEQVLYAGHDQDLRFFSLAAVLRRRYYIDVSKEMQSEFSDDIITDEKLLYAATDVVHLGKLYQDQRNDLIEEDLIQLGEPQEDYEWKGEKIPAVTENEVVLAFADIEYNGMGFDPEKWRENIGKAQPVVEKATKELNSILTNPPFLDKGLKLDVKAKLVNSDGKERTVETKAILPEDVVTVNWKSAAQLVSVLKYIFPKLEKASNAELRKFLQENDPDAPKENTKGKKISPNSKDFMPYLRDLKPNWYTFLKLVILKQYDSFEKAVVVNFRDKLIADKYLLPKGSVMINWNSRPTKLEIFKWFDSKIESTDAEVVENHSHIPFFKAFQEYQFANSLVTKYGEKFIENNVDSDGRVRTRFNTILSTGRVSSSSPNVQQIPSSKLPEDRQNDYRSCFNAGYDGWAVIGSDFASQELCVIASLSGDYIWLDALKTGKDLHSVAAEVIQGDRWKEASSEISGNYPKDENGNLITDYKCKFYQLDSEGNPLKAKCKCPGHKKMRQETKALNFGLAYGLGAQGLSADLHISIPEAEQLMSKYFDSFPSIKGVLDAFGYYGKTHGYIRTPAPLRRKRYFPYWKGADITSEYLLSKIERASKNAPIQGWSSDMVKIALCLMRRKINSSALRERVKSFVQVHDEISFICCNEIKDFVAEEVTKTMELAASICLRNDLLKTDTEISEKWQK